MRLERRAGPGHARRVSLFLVRVGRGEEVLETIERAVAERGVTAASITLIGAVKGCTLSVMPRNDETADILTGIDEPLELTGSGEVVDGKVHVHVAAGGKGRTVVGHLHRATVPAFFVRAYVTPLEP